MEHRIVRQRIVRNRFHTRPRFLANLLVTGFLCHVNRHATGMLGPQPANHTSSLLVSRVCKIVRSVLLVLFGLFVLDRARFRFIPRLLSCSLLAGLLAVVCKALVVRARPSVFVSEYLAGRATESFDRWLPYLTEGVTGSPFNSFPSAHTATAIGLAIGLSWLYPHARWYFFVLAFLAACQRIVVEAHYISDILVGGAIGSAFALLCIGPGYLGRLFTWLEQSSWPTKQDKTAKATPP